MPRILFVLGFWGTCIIIGGMPFSLAIKGGSWFTAYVAAYVSIGLLICIICLIAALGLGYRPVRREQ